jgi:hypothetical protein
MPCLGEAWNTGLIPGTPGYINEERRVQGRLEALLHVVDYYCKVHDLELPVAPSHSDWLDIKALPDKDKRLIGDIYHHLLCDHINTAEIYDIAALVYTSEERYGYVRKVVQTCFQLSRSAGLFEMSTVDRKIDPKTCMNALQHIVEKTFGLAKAGEWRAVLSIWADSPVVANRCSRYSKPTSKWTFLHQAAYYGDMEACRALIARGAFVDALTRDNRTPADVAEKKGERETEKLLRSASLGSDSAWVPSADPDVLPSSGCWKERVEAVAPVDLFAAYDGRIVRISKGSAYYMDSFQRILVDAREALI